MTFRPDIIAGRAVILVSIQDHIDRELRRVRTSIRRLSNVFSEVGGDLFRFGAVGTLGSILPIKAFISFQDQILFLQTKLQATDDDMKSLESTILSLGRSTSFTSQEVAKAATEFAKAGFETGEVQNSLEAALDLARSGQVDLSTATAILARTIRTFRLNTEDAPEVSSKFITAARLGTLNIVDLNESLKESSGTFKFLKVPLSEVLALITQLSNSSLIGTKAGTSLNTAYLNLTRRADKLQDSLGIKFTNLRDPVKVFSEIGKALKGFNEQKQVQILADIFNIRGGRAATAILIQGLSELEERVQKISGSFNEARISAKKLDSQLGGFFRRAKSSFENLSIAIGRVSEGPLSTFLDNIRKTFIALESLSKTNPKFFQTLLLIPPVALAAGASLLLLSVTLSKVAILISPLISLNALFFSGLLRGFVANRALLKVLTTMKGFRTLAFSGSGAFLLVEALILFGKKAPVINGFLTLITGAFTRLIGTISQLGNSVGPAFGIFIDGFNDPDADRGMRRMREGVKGLIDLIRIGLAQAWRDLVRDLDPITSRISAVFTGIGGIISEVVRSIGRILDALRNLFFGGGGEGIESTLAEIFSPGNIEALAKGIQNLAFEVGNLFVFIIEHIGKVIDEIGKLLDLLARFGLVPTVIVREEKGIIDRNRPLPEGALGSTRPIFGITGVPNEINLLKEEHRVRRENLKRLIYEFGVRRKFMQAMEDMQNRFSKMNRDKLPTDIQEQLSTARQAVSASLTGTFESTRGAKLKLISNDVLVSMNSHLENIDRNIADEEDDTF